MTQPLTSPNLEAGADLAAARLRLAPLPDEEKRVLSALAAIGGGPLDTARLAVLADVPDPSAALDALRDRQLVENQGSSYSLTGNLAGLLPSIWDLSPWCERALAYFLPWAEARREDPAELLREAGALRYLRDWAARSGRHVEAARLDRILDPVHPGSKRWRRPVGGIIRIPPVSFRLLPWLGVALLLAVLGGIRFASSRMAESPIQGRTAVPAANREPSPRRETPRISIQESTDLTTDLTATPPITTDLSPDAGDRGPSLEVPASAEFPELVLGSASPGQMIALTNAGTVPLQVAGISFVENPGQAFTLRSGCTRRPLPPGGRCPVQVFFHPPLAGSYHGLLAIDAEGMGRRTVEISGTATEEERSDDEEEEERAPVAPIPVLGWCCTSAEVRQSTEGDCKDRQGAFFKGQRAATAACLIVGCCVGGEFRLGETLERCDELGGTYMSAAEVPLRCKAP
jgi:hypothetical protein